MDSDIDEIKWFVAHTRPRCEKKLKQFCDREGFSVTLPLIKSVKKYRGKTVTFEKPLFANYLFLQISQRNRQAVYQSDYAANVIDVFDQELFQNQLGDILLALENEIEVFLAPQIKAGCCVKIKSGPMRGTEGWVEKRSGKVEVQLRLDFIGQAAAVLMDASELELV
jgi:transcriptional antiterminator RfaH